MEWAEPLAVAGGASFLAGARLYACVAALGIAGRMGWLALPGSLTTLQDPWVVGVALALTFIEFFADKVPWLDSAWDAVSTFVRTPGGAALAALAFTDRGPAAATVAALLGGTFALGVHGAKTTTRAAANTSPEPVSNWLLSLTEDLGVVGVVALMILAPLVLLIVLVLAAIALLCLGRWAIRRRSGAVRAG